MLADCFFKMQVGDVKRKQNAEEMHEMLEAWKVWLRW